MLTHYNPLSVRVNESSTHNWANHPVDTVLRVVGHETPGKVGQHGHEIGATRDNVALRNTITVLSYSGVLAIAQETLRP